MSTSASASLRSPPGSSSGGGFAFTPAGGQGTYVFFTNGDWTFDPAVDPSATDQTGSFSYRITDGDGDVSEATQVVNITNGNSQLAFNAVTGTVEEEHGLAGGIEDTADQNGFDTDENGPSFLNTVTNTVSGNFASAVASGADGALTFSFAALPGVTAVQTVSNGALFSSGNPVLYHQLNATTLIGYTNTDGSGTGTFGAGDTTVFTVTLTSAGAYDFTLNAPIDHPVNSVEDAIAINLGGRVQVVDAGGPAADQPATLNNVSITVIDDVPVTEANTRTVAEGSLQTVDIQFIVDRSGSMFNSGGGSVAFDVPGYSDDRMGLARYSMEQLLASNTQI